jgi:DNA-binding CsgD family transcriptional regulator/PAS domain-containing protein
MSHHDDLLRLIALAYDAAIDTGGWTAFLRDARTVFNAADASLLSHDLVDRRPGVSATTLDEEAQLAYLEHWGQFDPWARSPVTRTLGAGNVAVGEQLISQGELQRTAFYNDYGRRIDVERVILIMIEDAPHVLSAFSISRSGACGAFGRADVRLLKALAPHFRRALQIHRRLIGAEGVAKGLASALDRLPHGAILVGTSGLVMFANRAAEEILSAQDRLRIRGRELQAERPSETTAMRALIASAIGATAGDRTGSGGLVVIGRPSGRGSLRVLITPLPHRRVLLGAEPPAAMVFVTDPERIPLPPREHLRRLFGFTAAEARVALALLGGDSLERVADTLCISLHTARTHLRRLFDKTGTARQADLIRVLLGAHAPLRLD